MLYTKLSPTLGLQVTTNELQTDPDELQTNNTDEVLTDADEVRKYVAMTT